MIFTENSRRTVRVGAALLTLLAAPLTLSAKGTVVTNDACAMDGTCCSGNSNEICVVTGQQPIMGHYWQSEPGPCGAKKIPPDEEPQG